MPLFEHKGRKNMKRFNFQKKHIVHIFAGLFLIICVIYTVGFAFYDENAYSRTIINDVNITGMTTDKAIDKIIDKTSSSKMTLVYENGDKDEVLFNKTGSSVDKEHLSMKLKNIINEQKKKYPRYMWFGKYLTKAEYTIDFVDFNESVLVPYIKSMPHLQNLNNKQFSSGIKYNGNKWVVNEESRNSSINVNKLINTIKSKFQIGAKQLDLQKEKVYSSYPSQEYLEQRADLANELCNATISYKISQQSSDQEVISLTPEIMETWIEDDENNIPVLDEKTMKINIQVWIQENIFQKYSTKGKERTFISGNGNTITVLGGTYGNEINLGRETDEVLILIKNHEKITRTPVMSGVEKDVNSQENDGMGNTFLEFNLTDKKMYFMNNGKIEMTADFIAGDTSSYNKITPAGIYYIQEIKEDFNILQGMNDSGKYVYQNKVNYWALIDDSIPGRDIGICDTTDKIKQEVEEKVPVEKTVDKTYIVSTDGEEIAIPEGIDSNQYYEEFIVQKVNEALGNNTISNNTNETIVSIQPEEQNEQVENELRNKYRPETRKETETTYETKKVIKELDKTQTYGNLEIQTSIMNQLFDKLYINLPVIVHY